jgi:hypothetical protein
MRTRVGLVLNPNHETKKARAKTQHMWNKNQTRLWQENISKTTVE